jgi:hypothetical protein
MYLDRSAWPRPRTPQPNPRRLSPRGERVIGWIIAANLLLWALAPIGGATLFHALVAAFAR